MKRAKNVWLSVLGFALIAAGIYLIKTVPDPQGIMRALPFLLVGFGCGIFGHGLGELLAKKAAAADPETARPHGDRPDGRAQRDDRQSGQGQGL